MTPIPPEGTHGLILRGDPTFFTCHCLRREDGTYAPLNLPEGWTVRDARAAYDQHEAEVSAP